MATGGGVVVDGCDALVMDVFDSEVVVTAAPVPAAASTSTGATGEKAGAAEVVVVLSEPRVVVVGPSFRGLPT
jgi:hypothetical protein